MKRSLTTILAATLCLSAAAQLTIRAESAPIKEIAVVAVDLSDTFRSGTYLCLQNGVYYLSSRTSNRYDERFLFKLGNTKESALKTLDDLAALLGNEIGTQFILENWDGANCRCIVADRYNHTKKPTNGTKNKSKKLVFDSNSHAGVVILSKNHLKTLSKKLEQYREE